MVSAVEESSTGSSGGHTQRGCSFRRASQGSSTHCRPLQTHHRERCVSLREREREIDLVDLSGGETATLHVLGLLRECLANLHTQVLNHTLYPTVSSISISLSYTHTHTQHIKVLCEAILKTMTLGNTVNTITIYLDPPCIPPSLPLSLCQVVRTTCLHTLYGAMSSLAGPQGLTASLTAKITTVSPPLCLCVTMCVCVQALYDHQPRLDDSQLLQAWLTVVQAANTRLARSLSLYLSISFHFLPPADWRSSPASLIWLGSSLPQ